MTTYDPNTLKNLPKYVHELPKPAPGKPIVKTVDLSKLMTKWGKK